MLLCRIYESVVPKTIFLLHHGDSFVTLLSSLSIVMRKQLASPQHSIHGVNREVNAPAVLHINGARLEATSTIQYLVLCMRIHTRG